MHLSNLATNGTGHSQAGVHIAEETSRVLLDLADVEISTSVNTVGHDTSLERTRHAANASPDVAVTHGVGESDSWGSAGALGGLVHVGCGQSSRLVLASEVVDGDVVAESVGVCVDAEVVGAACALEAAGWGGAVDNLVGGGLDVVDRGELEGGVGAGCWVGSCAWWVLDVFPSTCWRLVLLAVGE